MHPVFGAWISFRVAIVVRADVRDKLPSDCDKPVPELFDVTKFGGPEMAEAIEALNTITSDGVKENWKKWLAVRDAIPIGREHRFSEGQIRYHYTGEMDWN